MFLAAADQESMVTSLQTTQNKTNQKSHANQLISDKSSSLSELKDYHKAIIGELQNKIGELSFLWTEEDNSSLEYILILLAHQTPCCEYEKVQQGD